VNSSRTISAATTAISLEQWQHDGESFTHRGERVFFRRSFHVDAANAPTLLLIHGFPTASWDWNYIWPTLSEHFNLIAPDMMGYGFSAKPKDYDYSIFDQADICEELVLRSRANDFHILAHDVGDTVAQELLARQLDASIKRELKSICFLNGGLFPETHRPRFTQRLLLSPLGNFVARQITKEKFAATMTKIFGANTPPSKDEITAFWHLMNEQEGIAVLPKLIGYMRERKRNRARWVGALTHAHEANVRLRLINGADDPVSGRHMAARYHALVPRADIVLINGIGHYPQIEAPTEVLRAFLDLHNIHHGA
jgi:pimeloyl-ACP methyl ester carboxylesterase